MSRKLTREEWIERAKAVHGDTYDYSKVEYINSSKKVCISCKIHGDFWQLPVNHIYQNNGCPICGKYKKVKNRKLTKEDFIIRSTIIHNNKFSYGKVIMGNDNKDKIIITCPIHGDFFQRPNDHLTGYGCRKCAEGTLSVDQFKEQAKKEHGGIYDYSKVSFEYMLEYVYIICPLHGEFRQQPFYHLRKKHGCPLCSNPVSRRETEWLDQLKISNKYRQYSILNGKYRVDGFSPKENIVYEFYGDYWHGNPKTFDANKINKQAGKTYGELYKATIEREQEINSHGYKVVAIWESDFIRCLDK